MGLSVWELIRFTIANGGRNVNTGGKFYLPYNESMNANTILNDEMSLEDKLKKIQELMDSAEVENKKRVDAGLAPLDPADLTMCEGCQ